MENDKTVDGLSDQMLIDSFLSGSSSSFEILYERYKRQLYSYLNQMLPGQHTVADDIFQQTWMKVIRKLPDYKCSNKFQAWLIRIAHNQTIDHFRRSKKENNTFSIDSGETEIYLPDNRGVPWKNIHHEELDNAVEKALSQLPAEQKEVFMLRQEQMSFKEIAEVQNCSINTVLGRMQYAIRNLRKQLNELYSNGG